MQRWRSLPSLCSGLEIAGSELVSLCHPILAREDAAGREMENADMAVEAGLSISTSGGEVSDLLRSSSSTEGRSLRQVWKYVE